MPTDELCKNIKDDSSCEKCSSLAESLILSKKLQRDETCEIRRILEKLNKEKFLTQKEANYLEELSEKYLD